MEEGSLRCDANVSVRPVGTRELGTKTELKNMNSFRFIERGIRAEIARQEAILRGGGEVEQETLHFDPRTEAITSLRSKEEAHDYRYFPEPDLVPIAITRGDARARPRRAARAAGRARRALRARPRAHDRHGEAAGVARRAGRLLRGGARRMPIPTHPSAQPLANWVNELVARIDVEDPAESNVAPGALATLVGLVSEKKVTQGAAKQVLDRLVAEGGDPAAIVEAEGLGAIGGDDELEPVVQAALDANPDIAERCARAT